MCLERAFSGYLAYFFEVGLRGDTKGPKRGKEGEGLSPVVPISVDYCLTKPRDQTASPTGCSNWEETSS